MKERVRTPFHQKVLKKYVQSWFSFRYPGWPARVLHNIMRHGAIILYQERCVRNVLCLLLWITNVIMTGDLRGGRRQPWSHLWFSGDARFWRIRKKIRNYIKWEKVNKSESLFYLIIFWLIAWVSNSLLGTSIFVSKILAQLEENSCGLPNDKFWQFLLKTGGNIRNQFYHDIFSFRFKF